MSCRYIKEQSAQSVQCKKSRRRPTPVRAEELIREQATNEYNTRVY